MNHNLAVTSQACEKYLLGELPPEVRDAYEEHYFSCPECAAQLRNAVELLGASRQILAERAVGASRPNYVHAPSGWLTWLRPTVAVPLFAALLLLVGYQNFVTIPRWKQAAAPSILPMHSLITGNSRGDESLIFPVLPDQSFGLYVDVPYDPAYSTYVLRLESPSGTSSSLRSLTSEEAQRTQIVTINPGRQAGKYVIVVSGLPVARADTSAAKELARLQFTIEFGH